MRSSAADLSVHWFRRDRGFSPGFCRSWYARQLVSATIWPKLCWKRP